MKSLDNIVRITVSKKDLIYDIHQDNYQKQDTGQWVRLGGMPKAIALAEIESRFSIITWIACISISQLQPFVRSIALVQKHRQGDTMRIMTTL